MLQRTHSSISTSFILSAETGERKERRWRSEEVKEKHTVAVDKTAGLNMNVCEMLSLLLLSSFLLCVCVCGFFFFLLGCSWTMPRNCPGLLSSVLHIKCGRPSAHWCAIFHPLAVQSGSVPALSFSVITHFGPDIVRKSRLFWQCEARRRRRRKNRGKRERREWNLCDCDSRKDSWAGLVKRHQ